MSCVVGIKHKGRVYIGGDSRANGDYTYTLTKASAKVFRCGQLLIGHCGSPRTAQIIRHVFQPEEWDGKLEPLEYLVTKFVLPLRSLLKEHGAVVDRTGENDYGDETEAWMLIGFAGRLFNCAGNFTVIEFADEFAAQGSGMPIAFGVLYATRQISDPKGRITLALEAACHFDAGNVGPPFIIESIEDESADALMMKVWQSTYDSHRKKCRKKDHSKCRP